MYLTLLYYPSTRLDVLDRIRRKYDPTVEFIRPHIPIVFPVPEPIGEMRVVEHIDGILSRWHPFSVRLRGFEKSPDHWLFLSVEDSHSQFVVLFESLYTGPLARFRRHDVNFVPHVALGLFVKKGVAYDMSAFPQQADFDEESYRLALQEAEAEQIDLECNVSRLALAEIPDAVLEWARGKRPDFPSGARATTRKQFDLGVGV